MDPAGRRVAEGQPCRTCGATERFAPRQGKKLGACKTCTRAHNRAAAQRYRERHPERRAATLDTFVYNRDRARRRARIADTEQRIAALEAELHAEED